MKRVLLKVSLFFGALVWLTSCLPTVDFSQIVYTNDFADEDLTGIENGRHFVFNNKTVLGFFHNDEVTLTLEDLPKHNYIKVTLDILIHDSWDGNPNDSIGGPDFWYMGYDQQEIFRTTFSNTVCVSTFCIHQSYPNETVRQNLPKTGAVRTNLPGRCQNGSIPDNTTSYSITRLIPHSDPTIKIFMGAELLQTNSPDPACDESWSVSKIEVEAVQTN